MRAIDLIVIHCSATRADRDFTVTDLDACHRQRGFNGIGYHYYIRRSGETMPTRAIARIGAHARGYNAHSIGICYEGGLNANGVPTDTRTVAQRDAMAALLIDLLERYPGCRVVGHRDLSPDRNGNGEIEPEEWIKQCPCFDVEGGEL